MRLRSGGFPVNTQSIISVFVVMALLGSTAVGQWHQTTDHNPWSVEIGGKFLDRPGTDLGLPLITNSVTRQTLFDSGDATDLGNTPAAEVKFNFQSKTGQEWEVRSMLANWEERIDPLLGPNLESPFFTPGTVQTINQFDYQYDSELYSFELMKRRSFRRAGLVAMLGPRFLSERNTVTHVTRASVSPGSGLPLVQISQQSVTSTKNTLIGLQGGIELNRPISPGLYISGFAKAGGYYNPTKLQTRDSDDFTDIVVTSKSTFETGSFLGETGGRIYMDIVPNVFTSYVGYEATWIDGFAASPEQVLKSFGTDRTIETTNTIFFHGITFGVKYTY
jgi:hypothetical protein